MNEIDEKQTVRQMRKELDYVKNYSASLRLQSIIYGEHQDVLQVEDEVSDYMHYTKSIVQVDTNKYRNHSDSVIDAMMRQQRHHEAMKQRDAKAYLILQGIAQLKERDRELLCDIYVRQYDRSVIMRKAGGIVESTYHRRLHKAILNLAIVLHREVYGSLQSCKE